MFNQLDPLNMMINPVQHVMTAEMKLLKSAALFIHKLAANKQSTDSHTGCSSAESSGLVRTHATHSIGFLCSLSLTIIGSEIGSEKERERERERERDGGERGSGRKKL